jgi:hypothetical protein
MPCHARAVLAAQIFGLHGGKVETEGADTPMLVLMRLIRSAQRPLLSRAVSAWEASRSPASASRAPGRMGFQQSAAPTMDDIIWFHDFVL